ncbi:MAG: lipid A biosynthesis acyltransferase [Brumimicrobium sp.]
MSEWKGKSKGTLLGYKIFAFIIRKIGIKTSYFVLFFVAFYYFLFSWSSNKAIYYYFRKRLKFSKAKSVVAIYRNYFVFGQTLLDRMLISSGDRSQFTYEFDGIENIENAQRAGNGGILISAHVGNFELAEHFYDNLETEPVVNILTTDMERQQIKHFLETFSLKSNVKFIILKDDMSHIFEFNEAFSNNELINITGDRFFDNTKTMEAEFLGEKALFPAGPFLLGSRLKVPVLFVYVMKESATHYHLYARVAEVKHRDSQGLLEQFIKSLTEIIDKYPYQWFNYYHFWK